MMMALSRFADLIGRHKIPMCVFTVTARVGLLCFMFSPQGGNNIRLTKLMLRTA